MLQSKFRASMTGPRRPPERKADRSHLDFIRRPIHNEAGTDVVETHARPLVRTPEKEGDRTNG